MVSWDVDILKARFNTITAERWFQSFAENFQKFLKLRKSHDVCQQDLYTAVLRRTLEEDTSIYDTITQDFQKFLKLKKSNDDCQQDLYTAVFRRPKEDRFLSETSRQSKLKYEKWIHSWMWDTFLLLSRTEAVIKKMQCSG